MACLCDLIPFNSLDNEPSQDEIDNDWTSPIPNTDISHSFDHLPIYMLNSNSLTDDNNLDPNNTQPIVIKCVYSTVADYCNLNTYA